LAGISSRAFNKARAAVIVGSPDTTLTLEVIVSTGFDL
jgi:hypothetical protein